MENPETFYTRSADGVYLAYQTLGEGPIDIIWLLDWPGNIDFVWDASTPGRFLRELASFARVIVHDQRGIGLSSRNVSLPNLETRVMDLRTVLDSANVDRAVLIGVFTSGSVNALFAATNPARVHSLVWFDPEPRSMWAPDYPWGAGPDYRAAELAAIELWGTSAYGVAHAELEESIGNAQPRGWAELQSRMSRNACTPDVALEMSAIWYDTDVRSILPAVRCPTLLPVRGGLDDPEAAYVASLMPTATVKALPTGPWGEEHLAIELEAIRSFIGVDPPAPVLDSILAAVLFTDIVGSTEKQAALGDAAWKEILERHHATVRHEIERWRGAEVDTAGDGFYATFEGPARAVRCALDIGARVWELGLEIRAGVHVGECTLIDGKVGGLPVTIGARIAALAEASQVLVSQTVKELVPGSGLAFEDAGEHELKGVPDRLHLYSVVEAA